MREEARSGRQPWPIVPFACKRPRPVGALVQRVGQFANPALPRRVAGEIRGRGQHAGKEERTVDRRNFALRRAPARAHVEKMVVEAAIARGVRFGALAACVEKRQRGERALDGDAARLIMPLSTATGYVASARPVAAMLAGQSTASLSRTRPLCGLVSLSKYLNERLCRRPSSAGRF